MRIAFYAPLKSPDHSTPSGDRQMGRLLFRALQDCGHEVEIVTHFRAYLRQPSDAAWTDMLEAADREIGRIAAAWSGLGAPDLWFCYHPYYKSPDLLGPRLAERFGLAYITAEASYSERRNIGSWAEAQARVADAVAGAQLNLCFTRRDRDGLTEALPHARLAMLPPFIDSAPFGAAPAPDAAGRLVSVAMMRPGDKFDSYDALARALSLLADLPWTLHVAGDGEARDRVHGLFEGWLAKRVEWLGALPPERIPDLLAGGGIFVWPGRGEAYGLAYLEAQAAGLPVVAQRTAGVPEVVEDGETGLLTPEGDVAAFAAAIRNLLRDGDCRRRMAANARRRVLRRHSLAGTSSLLRQALQSIQRPRHG